MKLIELKKLADLNKIRLSSSEESELDGNIDEFYEYMRDIGFYRVFETYYKDEYECTQVYCTGFLNAESGYEWLIGICDGDEDKDNDVARFKLYLELKDSTKWIRKQKYMFTGTLKEILKFSKECDKKEYKIARRWNQPRYPQ